MRIEIGSKATFTFEDLGFGETFIDPAIDDTVVFMVVEDYMYIDKSEDYDGYAIRLDTGSVHGYKNSEEVIRVNAKVVIEV